MSAELPKRLDLSQIIAYLAFGDLSRPLHPNYEGEAWKKLSALDQHSEDARRAWDAWNREAIALDRHVDDACLRFLQAIQSGSLKIAGDLVSGGTPLTAIDSRRKDPIPEDTLRLPCEIPREFLGNCGGWLYFRDGFVADRAQYKRYCCISAHTNDVLKLWPLGVSRTSAEEKRLEAKLVQIMRASPDKPRSKQLVAAQIGLSATSRPFERIWRNAAGVADCPAWLEPGRRSKSPR